MREVEEGEGDTTTAELMDNKAEDAAVVEGEEGEGEEGEAEGEAGAGGVAMVGLEEPASGVRRPWIGSWGRRRLHQSRCTSMSGDQETRRR